MGILRETKKAIRKVVNRSQRMASPSKEGAAGGSHAEFKRLKAERGEFPDRFESIFLSVERLTMIERSGIYANLEAVDYICRNDIPGSILECGIWRGGSAIAMLQGLMHHEQTQRDMYLFDTFEGMVEPGEYDKGSGGSSAHDEWRLHQQNEQYDWCFASIEEVRGNLSRFDYPAEKIHLIKGDVRETIPQQSENLGPIALLRLDTDWYESTRVEMEYLYDKVVPGGVLIFDDYGFWSGHKKAIDEFFAARGQAPFLMRIDSTKRIMTKI